MRVSRTSKSSRPTNKINRGMNKQSREAYVERLDKTKSSQLRSDDNDANRLISIDIVYDKLQNMKDEYRQFYSEEQNFEEAWNALLDDPDHFVEHLMAIFDSHNHVVSALIEFDKTFETNHLESLSEFVKYYEPQLHALSIVVQPDSQLRVKKRKLKDHFVNTPEAFEFLTKSGGFLRKLFDFYHKLKAIKPPTNKDEEQLAWYQGLFMDQKA